MLCRTDKSKNNSRNTLCYRLGQQGQRAECVLSSLSSYLIFPHPPSTSFFRVYLLTLRTPHSPYIFSSSRSLHPSFNCICIFRSTPSTRIRLDSTTTSSFSCSFCYFLRVCPLNLYCEFYVSLFISSIVFSPSLSCYLLHDFANDQLLFSQSVPLCPLLPDSRLVSWVVVCVHMPDVRLDVSAELDDGMTDYWIWMDSRNCSFPARPFALDIHPCCPCLFYDRCPPECCPCCCVSCFAVP